MKEMTIRILPPDEATKKARERVAEWKRQREIDAAKAKAEGKRMSESPNQNGSKPPLKKNSRRPLGGGALNVFNMFRICIGKNDLNGVAELISSGADVNAMSWEGRAPLFTTAAYGRPEIAELLISKGANISAIGDNGNSIIETAARHGRTELLNMLLANGADINTKCKFGRNIVEVVKSVRYLGKESKRLEVIELLKKHGATE